MKYLGKANSFNSTLEPAIRSCVAGQRIPYFDSCQFIIML